MASGGGAGGTAGASPSGGNAGKNAGGGGGGASDVRTLAAPKYLPPAVTARQAHDATASLKSRLIVAGGGGGGSDFAGGNAGADGTGADPAGGGRAGSASGGAGGDGDLGGFPGTLGVGGDITNATGGDTGGGGGGGFYGGGAGGGSGSVYHGGGGGGGSSAVNTGSGLKLATATATATATAAAPSITLTWTVPAAPSSVTLAADSSTQVYGTSSVYLTATVTVAGSNAGNVVFKSGTQTVETVAETTGTAVFAVPAATAVGSSSFTATFVPTDTTTVSGSTSGAVIVTVVAPTSAVLLTANKATQKHGVSTVIFTVVVSVDDHGSTAGRVVFKRGARVFWIAKVVAGSATFKVPVWVGVGKNKFFAVFTSSRVGVIGATSNTVTITVVK